MAGTKLPSVGYVLTLASFGAFCASAGRFALTTFKKTWGGIRDSSCFEHPVGCRTKCSASAPNK